MSGIIKTDPVVFYVDSSRNLVAMNKFGNIRIFKPGDILTYNKTMFSTNIDEVTKKVRPLHSKLQKQIIIKTIFQEKNIIVYGTTPSSPLEIISIKLPTKYTSTYIDGNPSVNTTRDVEPTNSEPISRIDNTIFNERITSFGGKTKRKYARRYKYSRRK